MSRGLGQTQRRALAILSTPQRGLTIAELSDALGLPERRTRKIVDSLVERRRVVADRSAGHPTRVWLAQTWQAHRSWQERQAFNLAQVIRFARSEMGEEDSGCPNCGWRAPTGLSGPEADAGSDSARCTGPPRSAC